MVLRFCTLSVRMNVPIRHEIALCYLFKKTTSMRFMNAREKVIMIKQLVDDWTMDQLIAAETTDEERLDQLLALIVKK